MDSKLTGYGRINDGLETIIKGLGLKKSVGKALHLPLGRPRVLGGEPSTPSSKLPEATPPRPSC